MNRFSFVALSLLLSNQSIAAPAAVSVEPIKMMTLGTYHFANPGKDAVNIEADDVTQPSRQQEVKALVAAIARFKPDRVFIERQIDNPSLTVPEYKRYRPSLLQTKHNENVQIGYRLGHLLKHENIYGFDEQPGVGEPDYFPLGKVKMFADASGLEANFAKLFSAAQKKAKRFERKQQCASIPELLLEENNPAEIRFWHKQLYYGLLSFGDRNNQAGADLNAYWYMRNAKMFAKIGLIAKPGERIFVLVGAGHKYWLDHFSSTAPDYERIDPKPYLKDAIARLPKSRGCKDTS
ncbi:MAG: DUF5694 domain-containing protein [Parasphingorhabdus sp.]|uniref:DUF5694 domain-containing protein n=1 Tax=Parasphingorhabdus sp. TaxID=2709688 RepID=UPI00329824F8